MPTIEKLRKQFRETRRLLGEALEWWEYAQGKVNQAWLLPQQEQLRSQANDAWEVYQDALRQHKEAVRQYTGANSNN